MSTDTVEPGDSLIEVKRQLDWRGPTGRPQGHVVLTRAHAEALMKLPALLNTAVDDAFTEMEAAVEPLITWAREKLP